MSSLLLRRTAWRDRSERFGVLLGATLATFVYFSFTTLTTIGDGDFTAAGNLGHTLAVTDGPFEQIYL